MEELSEKLTFKQKALRFIKDAADFIFRKVLLVDLEILLVVAVSFIFWGEFSPLALSERVFWAGMVVMICGAIVFVATGFTGKSFGVPIIIRKPEEAKNYIDQIPAIRAEVEKRYNVGARLWFIGMGCVGVSALVERLFS